MVYWPCGTATSDRTRHAVTNSPSVGWIREAHALFRRLALIRATGAEFARRLCAMPVETYTGARIRHLKALKERWNADLQPLVRDHPEKACHLLEALDDLQTMIGRLEGLTSDDRCG